MDIYNTKEVTQVALVLTTEEAQKLQALVAAVPVNTTDDFFDSLADGLEQKLEYQIVLYQKDENGEYGPPKYSGGGCGCGASDLHYDESELPDSGSNTELEGTLGGY